ncbi:MAG TPA: methyltransferase [Candidatus Dormibacteraeota bacterium]
MTERPAPPVLLQRMISGYTVAQVVYVAAKLGLPDLLAAGPRTAAQLAAATGCDPDSLARFLRAMIPLGLVSRGSGQRFRLAPLGRYLRSGARNSLRSFAIHAGEEQYQAWGSALHSARTGEPAFDHVFGVGFYEHMEADPERQRTWNQSMTETEKAWVVELGLVSAYPWSQLTRVVDVGGGHGLLLTAILEANRRLRGILFDLPNVVTGATARLQAEGLEGRCEVVAGDFFESVPAGADAYLLSRVLFNWDDDHAARILNNCRRAIAAGGRLLIIEPVVTDSPADLASLVDLNVFLVCGGRARTEAEHRRLLNGAGFELERVIDTPAAWGIIEAFPA